MENDWHSHVGEQNARALRTTHAAAFTTLSEIDRLGHLLLKRASDSVPVDRAHPEEWLTGIGLLRRAVATFAGTRTLLGAAAIDPAKALTRTHFELWLSYRVLIHGSASSSFDTPITTEARVLRGRLYRVADERRGLRSRALLLAPASPYRVTDPVKYDVLYRELLDELARLRANYASEWLYFGDLTPEQLLSGKSAGREPAWYTASFDAAPKPVISIKQLAHAFQYAWEYDVIYEALSGQVHVRGWSSDLTIEEDGVAVHHPHNPDWFAFVAYYASTWHLQLLMAAARAYAPVVVPNLQAFERTHMPAIRALDLEAVLFRLA